MIENALTSLPLVFEWQILLSMIIGLVAGIMLGAVPGLTAAIGISLLIPLTYGMDPLVALAMIAGIHNGGSYGGAILAILFNIPGTPGAVATTFDGYPMAKMGLAVPAVKIAALSSAIGGVFSAIVLLLVAPLLATVTLAFGPPELFWVNVLGLTSVAVLLGSDPLKGLISACLGLWVGMIGLDYVSGYARYSFDIIELSDGLSLLVVLVGLYALPAAWQAIEDGQSRQGLDMGRFFKSEKSFRWPWQDLFPCWTRASIVGLVVGLLPGIAGSAGGFLAYNEVRRTNKDPQSFGRGNPLGVAATEASNNADNGASMVPALTLGIPGGGVAALLLGALLIHGMEPGPQLFQDPEDALIVFGYIWAMILTSAGIYFFGGPIASRIFAQVLKVPPHILMPMIVGLTFVGIYTFSSNMFMVYAMFAFGFLGYWMKRFDFPFPPVVIGLVLGDKAEAMLRTSIMLSQGDITILFTRPISMVLVALVGLILAKPLLTGLKRRKLKKQDSAAAD